MDPLKLCLIIDEYNLKDVYSLGFGSVRSEDNDSITLNSDRAGDQFCFRMSMQIFPCSEICTENFKKVHGYHCNDLQKTHVHVVYSDRKISNIESMVVCSDSPSLE